MAGDSRIISFSSGEDDGSPTPGANQSEGKAVRADLREADAAGDGETWDEAWTQQTAASAGDEFEDASATSAPRGWIIPVIAVIAALGWSAFFIASQWPVLSAGPAMASIPALVSQWCVPLVLIALGWLLALRHSAREGKRFGDVARSLSVESARLERRLANVNGELSLAREFITAQGRDLEALGRIASERLSQNAERLRELIDDNGQRVDTIGSVSSAALENMEKLRGQLPVIASSAKDVTNNIANAGRTAHAQLEEMIAGFHRLNDFGTASERQVENMRGAVDAALAQFAGQCEDMEVLASQRFTALAESGAQFRTELEKHEIEALSSIRNRAAALRDEIERTRSQLDTDEANSLTSLRTRLAALRDESEIVSHALRSALTSLGDEQVSTRERIIADYDAALANLAERLAAFESEAHGTGERIATAQNEATSAFSSSIATIAAEAEASQATIDEQLEHFARDLQERQTRMAEQERHAVARVSGMLGELDDSIAERFERHRHQVEEVAERARSVTGQLEQFDARLRSIVTQSGDAQDRLLNALGSLTDNLTATRASLAATDGDVEKLTGDSLRLLDLLQASAKQAHSALPEAIAVSQDRITRLETGIASLLEQVERANQGGDALAGSLGGSSQELGAMLDRITQAQTDIADRGIRQTENFAALASTLEEIDAAIESSGGKAREELGGAIATLRGTLAEAIATIETEAPARIGRVADTLAEESGAAIEKAMRGKVAEISGQLEQAVSYASSVSNEAATQLREEVTKIGDLVESLEARLDDARERAEERVDNDFARRVALITESLNSSSIDIARALSTDVTDTAWAAYLRGDRGIFTRRAVSLIDNSEARAIQQVYERDDAFREHVSRYIHDFESMLRQVLSTRDGDALGVTLLSSDMGKLYVVLAQGIERLRS